jgi:dsDNA-specific endonuclease/ATPase MutS2
MSKTVEIGYMLSCYYELHENALYEESLQYAMGFDGYIHLMHGLYRNVQAGFLGYASFVSDKKTIDLNISGDETETQTQTQTQTQTEDEDEDENEDEEIEAKDDMPIEDPDNSNRPVNIIKSQYYPAHMYNLKCVKNDATLDDNIIITGPNASGKTTFLKSTALNVLFSQQVGVGFYQSCTVKPYQHMHSYLNIPDTSGRDSLFQAESRRCKEILTSIQSGGEQERHFCIFDELYSGTNPKEATKSAYAFMDYVRTFNNVDLVLTTHYTSICDRLEKSNKDPVKAVVNKQMEVLENDETGICKVKNTYKIIDGISTVEGAIRILEDMGYPEEMLETVKNIDLENEQLNTEMSIDL